MAELDNIEEI